MENILLLVIVGILLFILVKVASLQKLLLKSKAFEDIDASTENDTEPDDEDYLSAKDYVITTAKASTISLQDAFDWGYNKAARILNELEHFKVIGPYKNGEKYRKILVERDKDYEDIFSEK